MFVSFKNTLYLCSIQIKKIKKLKKNGNINNVCTYDFFVL